LWEIAALISTHTIDGKRARRADAKTKAFAGSNTCRGSRGAENPLIFVQYGDDKG